MYRQHFWHGNGIVRGTAMSGIDIALWDILGKLQGVPCHQLWGGRVRDFVRLYCHLGGGKMEEFYETKSDDAKRFGELAQQAVADGFTAFKSMAVPETAPIEGLQPIRYAEACVKAMREAVADKIDIMVDCPARPSPRMGMQFAKALEPYGLYFLEEPCWPETMEDIALIQRAVRTPIATGERLVGIHSFRELFEKRAASVIQPDITHCGGSGRWISGHPISNGANSSPGPVQPACWRWPQCKERGIFSGQRHRPDRGFSRQSRALIFAGCLSLLIQRRVGNVLPMCPSPSWRLLPQQPPSPVQKSWCWEPTMARPPGSNLLSCIRDFPKTCLFMTPKTIIGTLSARRLSRARRFPWSNGSNALSSPAVNCARACVFHKFGRWCPNISDRIG